MADYLLDRIGSSFRVVKGTRVVIEANDLSTLISRISDQVKQGKIDGVVHTGPVGDPAKGFLDQQEHATFWELYKRDVTPYHSEKTRQGMGPPDGRRRSY